MDVFAFVNAINFNKKDLMTGTENDALAEKSYVPYIINRTLSYFPDTIMYANDMNMQAALDNKLQFHYLLNSVRPQKRFSKWAKPRKDSDIENIQLHYKCSRARAREYDSILTKDQKAQIAQALVTGGRS